MNHINQAAAQCGMNAAPQNEIPSEMDLLNQTIRNLAEHIGKLACRIDPVLKDQPTCAVDRQPLQPINSKIGGELRALTNNVTGLIDTVSGIFDRVAL